jgi:hypothetical protein
MTARSIASSLFLAASLLTAPALADEVDTLFQEGSAAAQAGNFEVAYEKMSAAWARRPSFDIAANLAFVEQRLGKRREAAEHLEYALSTFPASADPATKTRMQQDLNALRGDLARVQVEAPEGCEIRVDGETRGHTPLPQLYLYVEPGTRQVEGTRAGEKGAATVEAKPGQTIAIKIVLQPAGGGETPKPGGESPVPLWAGLVAGGVGLAGLGAGIGLAVAAGTSGANADDATDALPSRSACQGATPDASCQSIEEDLETRDLLSNASMGAFIAGGVLIAGGAVLLGVHFAGGSNAPDERAWITPWFGPSGGGVGFGRSFW